MISMKTRIANAVALLAALIILAWVFVPPPQQSHAQFFGQGTFGGTSTNVSNAYSITINNWGANLRGVPITFIPNADNTGPATLNVSAIGAVNLTRLTSIGLSALSGSELRTGVLTSVMYDGTNFQVQSPVNQAAIGSIIELRGASAPPGYLIEDGSCVSQTTYAALFSVIATNYGSCSAGLFALPDSRGTMFAALDNQGVNGAANRITSGGSGCNATVIGLCGAQNVTLTLSQIPTGITSTASANLTVTARTGGGTDLAIPGVLGAISSWENVPPGAQPSYSPLSGSSSWQQAVFGATGTVTSTSANTSGSAHPVLNPISIGRRAIKY